MARKTEAPPYDDLINFPRAKDKDDIRCVMCGLPPGMGCVIPRQNKDVCKECDKSTWQHSSSDVYFKWCKGCKKFLRLGSFSEKLDAAKCDRCRERGRQSYLLKKGKDGGMHPCGVGRSRSNSVTSMKSDSIESEFSGSVNLTAAQCAVLTSGPSHTPRDSRTFIASCSGSSGVSSGDDDDRDFGCADGCQSGSDGDCDDPRRIRSPFCGAFSSGDEDTIISARAVASLSSSHTGSQTSLAPNAFSASPPPSDHAVVIDDDAADVTKSKLSSVFGKPLRELNRHQGSVDEAVGAERPASTSSDSSPGGHVGSALRGTLYELACIHQRIVTLEEHAARVKKLEATIEFQERKMEEISADASRLREELKVSKMREEAGHEEAGKLRAELRESHSAVLKRVGELAQLENSEALHALSAAIERDRKRPRVVSLGE